MKALLSKGIQAKDSWENADNIVLFKPAPCNPNNQNRYRKSLSKVIPFDSYKASKP
jgi:hypothetical protein